MDKNELSKMEEIYTKFVNDLTLENKSDWNILYTMTVDGLSYLLDASDASYYDIVYRLVFGALVTTEVAKLDLEYDVKFIASTQLFYISDEDGDAAVIDTFSETIEGKMVHGNEDKLEKFVDYITKDKSDEFGSAIINALKVCDAILKKSELGVKIEKMDSSKPVPDNENMSEELKNISSKGKKD